MVYLWLQLMTDVVGNPEEERRAEFYHEPWTQEAVSRYFYSKVRRASLQPPHSDGCTHKQQGILLGNPHEPLM